MSSPSETIAVEDPLSRSLAHHSSELELAIQTVIRNMKSFPETKGTLFHGLNSSDLELARIWCWQNFLRDDYDVHSILALYQFMQETWKDKLPLGPTAFRFCKNIEAVRAQHSHTKQILGQGLEAFARDEKIHLRSIDDYELYMHRHPYEFGSGLITLSMWREDRKIFQSSFYPMDPFKVYEIKGGESAKDLKEVRKRKRDYHRFKSMYGISPPSALVMECLRIAQRKGLEAEVAGWVPPWRNYDLAWDKTRRDQANSVHRKVKAELGLKYDEPTEAILETGEALKRIYSEPRTEGNSPSSWRSYKRCRTLIQSSSKQYASLFEGGADEFATNLLFSPYTREHVGYCSGSALYGNFRGSRNRTWELLSTAVALWGRRTFRIPEKTPAGLPSINPNEPWLKFYPPLFMRIDHKQRDEIVERYPQLNPLS